MGKAGPILPCLQEFNTGDWLQNKLLTDAPTGTKVRSHWSADPDEAIASHPTEIQQELHSQGSHTTTS